MGILCFLSSKQLVPDGRKKPVMITNIPVSG